MLVGRTMVHTINRDNEFPDRDLSSYCFGKRSFDNKDNPSTSAPPVPFVISVPGSPPKMGGGGKAESALKGDQKEDIVSPNSRK